MAKLYFKYGAMGSSKTAQALMTRFNYMEKNFRVWLIKPAIDSRDNHPDKDGRMMTVIRSRIGLEAEAKVIEEADDVYEMFSQMADQYDAVICDECQFLKEEQINQLRRIVDVYNVPVMCFGLRTDFQTKLFPGSKRLFEIADNISEIKSICSCGDKAVVNGRFDTTGNIVYTGDTIQLGGNERYKGMCYKCWKSEIDKDYLK